MIVLDTNVVSELAKRGPDVRVREWVGRQAAARFFVTAITQAEMLAGIEMLPAGKRRSLLHVATERMFAEQFRQRILPFDEEAAAEYAKIVAVRKRLGRRISPGNAMIAAIARSRRCAVATRDVNGFENCGIEVINPWERD